MALEARASTEGGDRRTPIAEEFRCLDDDLRERGRDPAGVEPRQDGIDGPGAAISRDDHCICYADTPRLAALTPSVRDLSAHRGVCP